MGCINVVFLCVDNENHRSFISNLVGLPAARKMWNIPNNQQHLIMCFHCLCKTNVKPHLFIWVSRHFSFSIHSVAFRSHAMQCYAILLHLTTFVASIIICKDKYFFCVCTNARTRAPYALFLLCYYCMLEIIVLCQQIAYIHFIRCPIPCGKTVAIYFVCMQMHIKYIKTISTLSKHFHFAFSTKIA